MGWLKGAGVLFIIAGIMYTLAAMGVEALENLTDSAGGPWAQGIGAIAIGIGMLIYAEKKEEPKKKTEQPWSGIDR